MKPLYFLALLFSLSVAAASGAQPNIVFFFIDDMGYRDYSAGGSDYFDTPNIDRIAAEGLSFTQGYVNAANCAPSRCTLLSGQYTPRNHFYNVWSIHRGVPKRDRLSLDDVPDYQVLPAENITFAEALKKVGYQTAMYGKWHISGHGTTGSGNEGGIGPAMQGFDDVYEHPASDLRELFKQDLQDPKQMFTYTKRAMAFAEKAVADKAPFLIYLAHHAVHGGNQSRPATLERYNRKEPGQFHNAVNPAYGAMMEDTDTSIGLMLDKLDELEIAGNTVVFFLSDNGGPPDNGASQAPLRSWKGSYYEGGIRVPFIVRWPGKIKPETTNDTPVMAIDLYPTMLEIAGVENIRRHLDGYPIDGESLLPLLHNTGKLSDRPLFWHFPAYLSGNPKYTQTRGYPDYRQQPVSVIRHGDFKLLLYLEEWSLDGGRSNLAHNKATELYNLKRDPSESADLSNQDPNTRDRLLDELLAWHESINAPIPKQANPDRVK